MSKKEEGREKQTERSRKRDGWIDGQRPPRTNRTTDE